MFQQRAFLSGLTTKSNSSKRGKVADQIQQHTYIYIAMETVGCILVVMIYYNCPKLLTSINHFSPGSTISNHDQPWLSIMSHSQAPLTTTNHHNSFQAPLSTITLHPLHSSPARAKTRTDVALGEVPVQEPHLQWRRAPGKCPSGPSCLSGFRTSQVTRVSLGCHHKSLDCLASRFASKKRSSIIVLICIN